MIRNAQRVGFSLKRLLGVSLCVLFFCGIALTHAQIRTKLQGAQKVEYLLNKLERSRNFKVRIAAATELGKLADGTLADWMLRAFRKEDHPAVRLSILYSVGQIPDHLVLPPLLELIQQELLEEAEIVAAEKVIWNLRRSVDVNAWTKALLDSPSRQERSLAAYLLGLVGGRTIYPALLAALSDRSAYVRTRTVQSLGRTGISKGLKHCQKLARKDPDRTVRRASKTCVGELRLKSKKTRLKNTRKVKLVKDLRGLERNAMNPDEMRLYWQNNVNPRELEEALTFLRKGSVQQRRDRSVPLAHHKRFRKTIRYDAEMITHYRFQKTDLNRLKKVVQKNVGYVNKCYLREVKKNPKLRGTVKMRFLVLKNGKVSTVQAVGGSLAHKPVRRCIANAIQKFSFPAIPLSYVTMNYTFSFTPPKDKKYKF